MRSITKKTDTDTQTELEKKQALTYAVQKAKL